MRKTMAIVVLALFAAITSCKKPNTNKLGKNDPFAKTMVASTFFEINNDRDTVIEGPKGVTVSLSKGSFLNSKGKVVNGIVKVELAEALTMDDMVLSNLTTTANGKPLESGGMIYLNATADGEELTINKDKPAYIEIPTTDKKTGMKIYRGERGDNGEMNWTEEKEPENYLVPVDIMKLEFRPKGFAAVVEKQMPWHGYKKADEQLIDSLYYSLSKEGEVVFHVGPKKPSQPAATMNEPYDNPEAQVVDGEYTKDSYHHSHSGGDTIDSETRHSHPDCGIDPAMIKALKTAEFQNTIIATREFEQRMRVLHEIGNEEMLMFYVNGIDKKLWQVDELVANANEGNEIEKKFRDFAKQKCGSIENGNTDVARIRSFYEKRIVKIQEEVGKLKDQANRELDSLNKIAEEKKEQYVKLLWKREQYRMQRYGFSWSSTGWVNVDKPVGEPHEVERGKLVVNVKGNTAYDRVHGYVIYENIKSLYKLNTNDSRQFFVGNEVDKEMLMIKGKPARIIVIAYKGDQVFVGLKPFTTGATEVLDVTVQKSTDEQVKAICRGGELTSAESKADLASAGGGYALPGRTIKSYSSNLAYDSYTEENNIALDLEYQAFFYKEELRQQQILSDAMFEHRLDDAAFPCRDRCNGFSASIQSGQKLFVSNCSPCHNVNKDGTGPALAPLVGVREWEYLRDFTRNWEDLVAKGDKTAIDVANSRPSSMNKFPQLTDEEIISIWEYIACESGYYSRASY